MIKVCQDYFLQTQPWQRFHFDSSLPHTDGGDMDARDSVRMRYEKRLREGLEDTSGYNQSIGGFERFTKVRRLLYDLLSRTTSVVSAFKMFFFLLGFWTSGNGTAGLERWGRAGKQPGRDF